MKRLFLIAMLLRIALPVYAQDPLAVSVLIRLAQEWEDRYAYDEALRIYQELLSKDTRNDPRMTAFFYARQAYVQERCGMMNAAIESIARAVEFDPRNPHYASMRSQLVKLRDRPDGRPRSRHYLALRDLGSAGRLQGVTGVLHIFAKGRNTDIWDRSDMLRTQQEIERASAWLSGQAIRRGVTPPPVFTHRFVELMQDPFLGTIDVPVVNGSRAFRESWLSAIPPRLGAHSYAELFKQVFKDETTRFRAVIFHFNREGRAFAITGAHRPTTEYIEKAFVHFPVRQIINPAQAVVYTHELLHLYGADDLYNKLDDPLVPEQEIMNFGGYSLATTKICPLTAYAVGWQEQVPPMKVLNVTTAPAQRAQKAKESL